MLNCVISTIMIYIVYLISIRIFNNVPAALLAAFVTSVYIYFLKYIATSGKEVWIAFFFAAVFLYMLKLKDKTERYLKTTVILSFLYAYFIHLDERYIIYAPLLFFFIIILDKKSVQNGIKKSLIFTCLVLLLMVPWLIRNYQVHNKVVIISLRLATVTDKLFGYPQQQYWDERSRWYMTEGEVDSVIAGTRTTTHLGLPVPPEQVEAMRNGIRPRPFSTGETMWESFKALWQPIDLIKWNYVQDGYRFDHMPSLKNNLSVFLTYGIMLIFSIFGMFRLFSIDKRIAWFVLSIFIFHTLIHVVFIPFTEYRYRIPIDSVIITLGAYGIYTIVRKYILAKRNNSQKLAESKS